MSSDSSLKVWERTKADPVAYAKRKQSCKDMWTPAMREAQSLRMSLRWATNDKALEQLRDRMIEENPMDRPEVQQKHKRALAKARKDPEFKKKQSEGIKRSWTAKRRKQHAKDMRDPERQAKMQANGNVKRRGKPNKGAKAWYEGLSRKEKVDRSSRISKAHAANFKGRKRRVFVKGCQGFLKTRFGTMRYDSSWEKRALEVLADASHVVSVERDFAIPYNHKRAEHMFLVDFYVELSKGNPILLEIKSPYFLGIAKEKTKIRAARRYAYFNDMQFILATSLDEVEEILK